jgi:hypothetical protein
MSTDGALKLKAEDAEDLAIIAAHLQDAIACLAEMRYVPEERRFALVVERFLWEDRDGSKDAEGRPLRAVRAGLHFDRVSGIQVRGIDQTKHETILELLTILPGRPPQSATVTGQADEITLLFAGGGEIRLKIDCLACWMRDLETPRPTGIRPRHPLDEAT